MSTSFLTIQAQRDLAQARTNELGAVLAYDLSLVDFEALQEAGPVGRPASRRRPLASGTGALSTARQRAGQRRAGNERPRSGCGGFARTTPGSTRASATSAERRRRRAAVLLRRHAALRAALAVARGGADRRGAPAPRAAAGGVEYTLVNVAALEVASAQFDRLPRTRSATRFVRTAKRRWSSFCMADSTGRELTFGRALVGSLLLARAIRRHVPAGALHRPAAPGLGRRRARQHRGVDRRHACRST